MKFPSKAQKNAILTLLFSFILSLGVNAQSVDNFNISPKYEVRAVWLTTLSGLDWPKEKALSSYSIWAQKEELSSLLDHLKSAGINTVLFQTRIRGTLLYPSQIEPWDECLTGKAGASPGYDPLAFAIEECHKRGMEIQAWIVSIPLGKWNSLGCKTLRSKYPNLVLKVGDEGYINPEASMASTYLARICKEITQSYDIDGIHLDYIRYPETLKLKISSYQARENITSIVREISREVKSIKPWVKISSSPIGKFKNLSRFSSRGWDAYSRGYQDVQSWLKEGIMDQIYPMMYFQGDQYYPFVFNWKDISYGKAVATGIGIYCLTPKEGNWPIEEIMRQMSVARSSGLGYAFFRAKFLIDNVKGIYDFTRLFNTYPALVPKILGSKEMPLSPKHLKVEHTSNYDILSWDKVPDQAGGVFYNIYASKTYPVDVNLSKNLIIPRYQSTSLSLEKGASNLFYAVTTLDRYGSESAPIQQVGIGEASKVDFIKNDGKHMLLPLKTSVLDAEYIVIESLQGNIIATRPFRGKYADISKIKDGIYKVSSLNSKNVVHRLGFLLIKRKAF